MIIKKRHMRPESSLANDNHGSSEAHQSKGHRPEEWISNCSTSSSDVEVIKEELKRLKLTIADLGLGHQNPPKYGHVAEDSFQSLTDASTISDSQSSQSLLKLERAVPASITAVGQRKAATASGSTPIKLASNGLFQLPKKGSAALPIKIPDVSDSNASSQQQSPEHTKMSPSISENSSTPRSTTSSRIPIKTNNFASRKNQSDLSTSSQGSVRMNRAARLRSSVSSSNLASSSKKPVSASQFRTWTKKQVRAFSTTKPQPKSDENGNVSKPLPDVKTATQDPQSLLAVKVKFAPFRLPSRSWEMGKKAFGQSLMTTEEAPWEESL